MICTLRQIEVGGTCRAYGGEEERVHVIGSEARGKETTRKTKTSICG
jgi:hypothetical protein